MLSWALSTSKKLLRHELFNFYSSPVNSEDDKMMAFLFHKWIVVWAAPCENVSSGICGQRRSRSACTSAQSDQGLYYSLKESLETIEYINGDQIPEWDFLHTRDDWICTFCTCLKTRFRVKRPTSFCIFSMSDIILIYNCNYKYKNWNSRDHKHHFCRFRIMFSSFCIDIRQQIYSSFNMFWKTVFFFCQELNTELDLQTFSMI